MDHDGFKFVVNAIRDDDIFCNHSRHAQEPVDYQVMVALSRLGHYGNGVGARSTARTFRVSGKQPTPCLCFLPSS